MSVVKWCHEVNAIVQGNAVIPGDFCGPREVGIEALIPGHSRIYFLALYWKFIITAKFPHPPDH